MTDDQVKTPPVEHPVCWLKRGNWGYEIYLYTPGENPNWLEFDTFECLLEWLAENPNVLLTKDELKKDYLQLEFKGFDIKETKNGA